MKKYLTISATLLVLLAALLCTSLAAESPDANDPRQGSGIFSWDLFLLNEGAYDSFRPMLQELHITRVYQSSPAIYFETAEYPSMVRRLAADGIEIAALVGEREWGLPDSDLSELLAYIDAIAAYNEGPGADAPIRTLALDVETYTYTEWKRDRKAYFAAYVENMQTAYAHAHDAGLEVVQIIPVFFDTIDQDLFRLFLETCCDELALMNYTKKTQVSAICQEVELCSELGMRVETIFETMPYSEKYSVSDANTYFYDGLSALASMKERIFDTYSYENLSVSYHYLNPTFHLVTGTYFAEIYPYTDSNDPTRNEMGQTNELSVITLLGNDGSEVRAYLYHPNRHATHPEVCYLAVGIRPGVTYTIISDSDDYTPLTRTIVFTLDENELVDYVGIRLLRTASSDGETQPDPTLSAGSGAIETPTEDSEPGSTDQIEETENTPEESGRGRGRHDHGKRGKNKR